MMDDFYPNRFFCTNNKNKIHWKLWQMQNDNNKLHFASPRCLLATYENHLWISQYTMRTSCYTITHTERRVNGKESVRVAATRAGERKLKNINIGFVVRPWEHLVHFKNYKLIVFILSFFHSIFVLNVCSVLPRHFAHNTTNHNNK